MNSSSRKSAERQRRKDSGEKRIDLWLPLASQFHLSLLMARHKTNAPETIRIVLKEAVEKDNG